LVGNQISKSVPPINAQSVKGVKPNNDTDCFNKYCHIDKLAINEASCKSSNSPYRDEAFSIIYRFRMYMP